MTGADQPHVLVVDDDDRLRDLLTRYLGENGFRALYSLVALATFVWAARAFRAARRACPSTNSSPSSLSESAASPEAGGGNERPPRAPRTRPIVTRGQF